MAFVGPVGRLSDSPVCSPAMSTVRIAFLGDIYGSPGRQVVQQQLPNLRAEHKPDLVIANAENARSGSGLSPALYQQLRKMGIDGMTLGDHVFREQKIISILETPTEPLIRPANLADRTPGRRYLRLPLPNVPGRSLFVVTVLGRIFMNMPANDPFAAVDCVLAELPEANPLVIVEAHMEATSEKSALAHYLDGRVAAVLGTHTHIPTADARRLAGGTAFISDLGMCGPYNSIIGANIEAVVQHMTTSMHAPFGVARGDEKMCGAVIEIDLSTGRSRSIERVEYSADYAAQPFC
ncbi:MAG: YmdB family metallophosphoesterase [Phycisphaerales bacterium]|nr:MAG: YmdB family metallophosphoesterase [Phycisphaerales bacterium]